MLGISGDDASPLRGACHTGNPLGEVMSVPHPAPGRTAAPRSAPGSNRLIASWAMVSTGAVVLIAIIVFALQNTGGVGFSFLWMHGTLPLSMALLVAGLGGAVLALLVGTTRVADLRRLSRGRRS